jgi:ketosteroid isomerase-like protein
MNSLDRMMIERECEKLVMQYCHFIDHQEAARVAELFAQDGVWASADNTMAGRAAILKGFQGRQDNLTRASRHICSNLIVEVIDESAAKGVVYLTLYRHDGELGRRVSPVKGPSMIGEYRDEFVRTPDGWRFLRREVSIDFLDLQ